MIKIKTLFIYTCVNKPEYKNTFHFGLGHLSSILKKNGHETSLLHITEIDRDKIIKNIKKEDPGLIGITAVSTQMHYVKEISKITKEMKIFTVVGGIHATLKPECIKDLEVDGVIRGEGEYPILDLANALESGKDHTKIKNLWVKKGGKLIKNPMRPLVKNIDVLPFPDRELFDYERIVKKDDGRATFMWARGCPFKCTYCCNHAISDIYSTGNYLRHVSPERCIEEIREVTEKYKNVRSFYFGNDSLNADRKWLSKLLKLYKKEFGWPFRCLVRPSANADRSLFEELKAAGCYSVFMGIESGNEYIRNMVMKRGITDQQIYDSFRLARESGLKTLGNNIIGLPYETEEMLKDTIKMNAKVNPDMIGVGIFYPYEGTVLGDECRRKGLITDERAINERKDSIIKLEMSRKKLFWYYKNFHYLVYTHMGNRKKALYYKALNYKTIVSMVELLKRRISYKNRRRLKKLFGDVEY